jgi:phosphatidyl-myo-inositol dimannoside synthase
VATNVGGIPEVLPPDCLVPPRDAAALARCIGALMADGERREFLGRSNREVASGYHDHQQAAVRREFLRTVGRLSVAASLEPVHA